MNLPSPSVRWAVDCVAHPDERPYPFLSTGLSEQRFRFHNLFESNHERFLTFVCSDESALCCQLSRLEAAVAIARTLQRTLVIPAAISRAHLDSYFNLTRLQRLVRVVSEQDVRFLLGERCNRGELVGLACATIRASAWMPWIEVGADCEAHSAAAASHFLSDFVAEVELCIDLEEPMRGADVVLRSLGRVQQQILVIDDCLGAVAPCSLLDAGERELLHQALRPCGRLRTKLRAFLREYEAVPFLAVRADVAESQALIAALDAVTRTPCKSWVHASAHPAYLPYGARARVECARLFEGEDPRACEVLRVWLCAFADYFIGAAASLDSEWVRRFRVSGSAKFADHVFVPCAPNGEGTTAATCWPATGACHVTPESLLAMPTRATIIGTAILSDACEHACESIGTSACCHRTICASSFRWRGRGEGHRVAMGCSERCSSSVRRISSYASRPDRPDPMQPHVANCWEPSAGSDSCMSAEDVFRCFLRERLPALRAVPMHVAAPGTTDRVAVIVEPRCDPALEHCLRNVAHFLGPSWQLQVFHGTGNEQHITQAFRPRELAHMQLVPLGVDNLTRKAYSELLCSYWFWDRVAAECVLVFQTDTLLCRHGIDAFTHFAYVGAPFPVDQSWSQGVPWLANAGNGGLSIRSRRTAYAILDAIEFSRGEPEDLFFVEHTPRVGGLLASRHEASWFAVESVCVPDVTPLGFHKVYAYLPKEYVLEMLCMISYDPLS